MRSWILTVMCLCAALGLLAQSGSADSLVINLKDNKKDPYVLVYHNMGNVSVEGHQGRKVFVYSQELLPSLSYFFNNGRRVDRTEHSAFVDQQTGMVREINQNSKFRVIEQDNIVQVQTNAFSFNTNVFVMVPKPSDILVNITDMGSIEIKNIEGDIEANTRTGNIYVEGVNGSVVANTEHGSIVGDFSKRGINRPLMVSTLVGNIELIVPEKTTSNLKLYSELGKIYSNLLNSNDLNLLSQSLSKNNRKINFQLNGGGTEFVANVFKGDIYLRHSQ